MLEQMNKEGIMAKPNVKEEEKVLRREEKMSHRNKFNKARRAYPGGAGWMGA